MRVINRQYTTSKVFHNLILVNNTNDSVNNPKPPQPNTPPDSGEKLFRVGFTIGDDAIIRS